MTTISRPGRHAELTVVMPANVNQSAIARAHEWSARTVSGKVAAIAQRDEFVKVTVLERRKAEAEAVVQAKRDAIASIREACASNLIANADAIDEAASQIEACERAIATAKLTVETAESLLPQARLAMDQVAKDAVRQVVNAFREEVRGEQTKADEAVERAVERHAGALLEAVSKLGLLDSLANKGAAFVFTCGGRAAQPAEAQ